MKMQQESTTGDEGVEVLQNRPFSDDEFGGGQYTSKFYHLQSKAPSWLTTFAPADALVMQEEAWNAYPKCRSVVKSPYFSKFFMSIDTIHKADNGYSENVHGLSEDQLAVRQVEVIDIASAATDYWSYIVGRNNVDLSNFQSARCGRGPLLEGWQLRGLGTRLCNLLVVFSLLRESVLEFRRNQSSSSSEGQVVKEARGVGMILTNTAANGEELVADSHLLAVAVGVMAERAVKHYALAQNAISTLRFLGTKLSIRPSTGCGCTRGTNFLTLEILKPVMVAPGVNIVAA
uniref:Phosphatidylinositol transfer protein n=1 Tax=Solanum tuberosum TaxID=4113 RepID=M1CDT0_SOLTU